MSGHEQSTVEDSKTQNPNWTFAHLHKENPNFAAVANLAGIIASFFVVRASHRAKLKSYGRAGKKVCIFPLVLLSTCRVPGYFWKGTESGNKCAYTIFCWTEAER